MTLNEKYCTSCGTEQNEVFVHIESDIKDEGGDSFGDY